MVRSTSFCADAFTEMERGGGAGKATALLLVAELVLRIARQMGWEYVLAQLERLFFSSRLACRAPGGEVRFAGPVPAGGRAGRTAAAGPVAVSRSPDVAGGDVGGQMQSCRRDERCAVRG